MKKPEIDERVIAVMKRRIRPKTYFDPQSTKPLYLHIDMPKQVSPESEFVVVLKINKTRSPYPVEPKHEKSGALTVGLYGTGFEIRSSETFSLDISEGALGYFFGYVPAESEHEKVFVCVNYNRDLHFVGVKKAHIPIMK